MLRYAGVDWIAMLLTFTAIYQLGSQSKTGFITMMCGNLCWVIVGVMTGSVAMVVANLIFLLTNARGWTNWTKVDRF